MKKIKKRRNKMSNNLPNVPLKELEVAYEKRRDKTNVTS